MAFTVLACASPDLAASPTLRPSSAADPTTTPTTRPAPTRTPTPDNTAAHAEHIVGFLDELRSTAPEDYLDAIMAESEWVSANADASMVVGKLEPYMTAFTAVLQAIVDEEDYLTPAIAMMGMRDEIAALVPGGVEQSRLDMQVAEHGYTAFGGDTPYVSFGVVLENPNRDTHVAERVTVTVTLLDAEGAVVTTDDEYIDNALPGQKVAVGGTMFDSAGVKSMEVDVAVDWIEVAFEPGAFTFDKVRLRSDEYESRATGTVRCTFSEDQKDVEVVAIFRSKAGKVVGGDTTYVDTVRCSKGSAFEVSTLGRLTRATKVEMYAAS